MEYLLQQEESLKLSWNLGCTFISSTSKPRYYIHNEKNDPSVTETINSSNIAPLPKTLVFVIQYRLRYMDDFKENIHNKIFNMFQKYVDSGDEVQLRYKSPQDGGKTRGELKPEFIGEELAIKEYNRELKDLGKNIHVSGFPDIKIVPESFYNWTTFSDYKYAHINVCCHSETQCYRDLQQAELLNKYMPLWYKQLF